MILSEAKPLASLRLCLRRTAPFGCFSKTALYDNLIAQSLLSE
jgi:hypothetical protein